MVNSMLESRIKGYSVELRDHGNQKTKQMVELEREPKFSIVLNLAVFRVVHSSRFELDLKFENRI